MRRPLDLVIELVRHAMRDAGARHLRDIDLTFTGSDIEVPAYLSRALAESLGHLVRSCVERGIEDRQRRAASGKSPRGKVTVAFDCRGDWLTICVADDGAGVSSRRDAPAAERRHGLAVVQRWADTLGGSFELASEAEHGTGAVLCIPMRTHNPDARPPGEPLQ